MIKQLLFITFVISAITSNCLLSADEMCASCMLGLCAYCRGSFYDLTSTVCKTPATLLANCASYKSETECNVCEEGYYLKEKVCVAIALENCAYATSAGVCTTCKDSKKYDSVANTCTDTACSTADCKYCMVAATVETCSQCNSDFIVKVSGSTVTCVADTTNCVATNPLLGGCALCEEGYYMKGTTCVSGSVQKLGFLMFFAFLLM